VTYILICLDCEPQMPIPFPGQAERGKWAAAHTKGTGHDRWMVLDLPSC
jgi:hypothetical protein